MIFFTLLIALFILNSIPGSGTPEAAASEAIIYVSIVSHNEEPNQNAGQPDFTEEFDTYSDYRNGAVDFAKMVYEEGAKYNFQSDWNFLLAEEENWQDFMDTNGKNLLRWLMEDLNFAVDPHGHESLYSLADVAYLMQQLGITPSNIVGGFIASPSEESRVADFQEPVDGWQFDSTWEADALWGSATGLHAGDSDLQISGIWRAKDNENFTSHEESSKPIIGTYTNDWDGLDDLLEKRGNGELDSDEMYTITIMNNQEDFTDPDYIQEFRDRLLEYQDETKEGIIQWVTLEEALEIWKSDYNSNPNIYSYKEGSLTEEDATGFSDIGGHWAEEVILILWEAGVIDGKDSTYFAPDDAMSRAELLKVALLTAGYEVDDSMSTAAFTDVDEDEWFSSYIAFAYSEGFVEGYEDKTFRPNSPVNRAEALAMLLRIAGVNLNSFEGSDEENKYSDVDNAEWFYSYVSYANEVGIVEGYADGSFKPGSNVSRAEFCTMSARALLGIGVLSTGKELSTNNVLFTVNTQEFIFVDESIETLNRIIDIHESYNVPVDIYLDDPILQAYLEKAPELIERLRTSSVVSISYHARPPVPYYYEYDWLGLEDYSEEELIELIEDYGTHAMDSETGETTEEPGGFAYFEDVFGYAPPAAATPTDSTTGGLVNDFFEEYGASFIVDNSRDYSWGESKEGLAVRPEDVEIKLFERTDESAEDIFSELDALSDDGPYFMNIKVHDNDFIVDESAWLAVYLANKRQNGGTMVPPFDLSDGEDRTLLSEEEAEPLWALYEVCVAYASENGENYTIWNMLELKEAL